MKKTTIKCDNCKQTAVINIQKLWCYFPIENGRYGKMKVRDYQGDMTDEDNMHLCRDCLIEEFGEEFD